MRSGTEGRTSVTIHNPVAVSTTSHTLVIHRPALQLSHFLLSSSEKQSENNMRAVCNEYMLLKLACETDKTMIDIQTYFTLRNDIQIPECSNIIYYSVLDQKCDDKETLLNVINTVYEEFIASGTKKIILLEGDQVTYERLQSIKREYGNDLSWMYPFPGDWHFLKNFQEVLIKIYYDGGLMELAKASGYQPNSVCSNFKRTHNFLLEVWESLYHLFLSLFLTEKAPSDFLEYAKNWVASSPPSADEASTRRNLDEMLQDLSEKNNYQADFAKYLSEEVSKDATANFWSQFVFQDCYAYVALFLAIRSGNWDLRMAAIKSMAPLFAAFDRVKYQKLIAMHIVDMLSLPTDTLSHLQSGGFTVSIKGRPCHSIGIDEAHEMCVNKDSKEYASRPSGESINRTALFIPVRSAAMRNIESQAFPEKENDINQTVTTIFTTESGTKKFQENVNNQVKKLKTSTIISSQQKDHLHHLFNQKTLTTEQIHDLLSFRKTGQHDYQHSVEYFVLRNPSVKPPKHRKRVLTFTEKISRRKKVSTVEKERKVQIECWKKRVAFAISTGAPMECGYEQCIELPRAIATSEGKLHSGNKSNTTKVYEKRYLISTDPIISSSLQPNWVADTVIMEGMFLINIKPWSAHRNFGAYAEFLLQQHIQPHFRNGSQEIHLLFDDPNCQGLSPKVFERQCRDICNPPAEHHVCIAYSPDVPIPQKWRENVLNCRSCKRNLVYFLSGYLLDNARKTMHSSQRFIVAGAFTGALQDRAMFVTAQTATAESDDTLICNAEETDMRIWIHTLRSPGRRKLVLSPDTDVYHIGLPIVAKTDLEVIVRLNQFTSVEHRLLNVQSLILAFENDPELSHVSTSAPSVMQALFVCTGCDFDSFFDGIGKTSFLATLFEYCDFICANSELLPGTLSDNDPNSQGIFAFIRLIGCAYFRKHKSAFLPAYPSPATLYNSLQRDDHSPPTHHSSWLGVIRERIWSKVRYEEDMLPSDGALTRHWMRSCWVLSLWKQADSNHIQYPPLQENGWKLNDSMLLVDWDSEENIGVVRSRVALLRKGCGCKTGCRTGRCKCRKNNVFCGPGCKCLQCCNLPMADASVSSDTMSSDSDSDQSDADLEEELTMSDIFGSDEDSDYC